MPTPWWDFPKLQDHVEAFHAAVEYHYRYYQFYGNAFFVLLLVPGADIGLLELSDTQSWLQQLPKWVVLVFLFMGTRDAIVKYYERAQSLTTSSVDERRTEMTNGSHPTDPKATMNALVAQAIYDVRTAAGLTQEKLADRIDTKQPVISQLEDADYEGHSLSMLKRIADALDQRLEIRFVPQGQHA